MVALKTVDLLDPRASGIFQIKNKANPEKHGNVQHGVGGTAHSSGCRSAASHTLK